VVNRLIGGVSRMYLERFARIDEAQTGLIVKTVDCSNTFVADPVAEPFGVTNIPQFLPQLAGQYVTLWADGFAVPNSALVAADGSVQLAFLGIITNNGFVKNCIGGLPYTADFISAKLAYGAAQGNTSINKVKRVDHIGLVLQNTHYQGLKYGLTQIDPVANAGTGLGTLGSQGGLGPITLGKNDYMVDTLEPLDNLPLIERGAPVVQGTIWAFYDEKMIEIAHNAITDPRLHLQATSPFPCTVLAVSIGMEMDV
jgi:hypothetical protein